ncbi:MAG: hypothetical protein EXR67_01495 [Dehalococcoidia bacterium]|nr:hypothetical protein [Dehalococcoidia bacterium]
MWSSWNQPDVVEVRYGCPCGCKPRARHKRGTEDVGHEHYCSGNVHFVGAQAAQKLQAYMVDRGMKGEDVGMVYTNYTKEAKAP